MDDRFKSGQSVQAWHDPPRRGERKARILQLSPSNDTLSRYKQIDGKALTTEEMPSINLKGEGGAEDK